MKHVVGESEDGLNDSLSLDGKESVRDTRPVFSTFPRAYHRLSISPAPIKSECDAGEGSPDRVDLPLNSRAGDWMREGRSNESGGSNFALIRDLLSLLTYSRQTRKIIFDLDRDTSAQGVAISSENAESGMSDGSALRRPHVGFGWVDRPE